MEFKIPCLCCLLRPPDKDLKIPYTFLGNTEIYADMLKDCFEIHLQTLSGDGSCGICTVCVARLRDASDFKLQVQRSQAELHAWLKGNMLNMRVKGETTKEDRAKLKLEISDDDDDEAEPLIHLEKFDATDDPLPRNENQMSKRSESVTDGEVENKKPVTKFTKSVKRELINDMHASQTVNTTEAQAVDKESVDQETVEQETVEQETVDQETLDQETLDQETLDQETLDQETSCDSCDLENLETTEDSLPRNENQMSKHSESVTEGDEDNKKPVTKFTKQTIKPELINDVHASQTDHTTEARAENQETSCDSCGKHFTNKLNLANHVVRVHKQENVYTCEVCHSEFNRFKQLANHKRVHKGEKPFSCPICNKKFRESASLIIHDKIHTGERPFTCEICKKKYTTKKCLLSHKRNTHSDAAKTYVCNECNKRFASKGNLIAHIRVHTGEKPYQCEVCGKKFNHITSFNYHVRTHAKGRKMNFKYVCKLCNKNFRSLSVFMCHERVHNGEKPYSCDQCDKKFRRKDQLYRHKRRHVAFKQFCCEFCGKQFKEISDLNEHKVVHGLGKRRRRRPKRSRRDPIDSGQAFPSDQLTSTMRDVPPPNKTQRARRADS